MAISMFLVLPEVPFDQKIIWDPGYSSLSGQWTAGLALPQKPYTFRKKKEEALKMAQEYAKTYLQPYYVAEVDIIGRYAPPPPAYEPVFEDKWEAPK